MGVGIRQKPAVKLNAVHHLLRAPALVALRVRKRAPLALNLDFGQRVVVQTLLQPQFEPKRFWNFLPTKKIHETAEMNLSNVDIGFQMGDVELVLIKGPMFAGKTSEMMRRVRRLRVSDPRFLILRPEIDTRTADCATHDGNAMPAVVVSMLRDAEILSEWRNATTIGIDEGQFFPDLAETAVRWVEECNKTVIVAALDGKFDRTPWPSVVALEPLCDHVEKLNAVCTRDLGGRMCGKDAPFSLKFRANEDRNDISIGGKELYGARCRGCYRLGE